MKSFACSKTVCKMYATPWQRTQSKVGLPVASRVSHLQSVLFRWPLLWFFFIVPQLVVYFLLISLSLKGIELRFYFIKHFILCAISGACINVLCPIAVPLSDALFKMMSASGLDTEQAFPFYKWTHSKLSRSDNALKGTAFANCGLLICLLSYQQYCDCTSTLPFLPACPTKRCSNWLRKFLSIEILPKELDRNWYSAFKS